jgi:uracil-DNA glycosylase
MIDEYFKKAVDSCCACKEQTEFAEHLTLKKLPPFIGGDQAKVLIIGHSPRVRTRSNIQVTLDLDSERQLKRYIVGDILSPLGLSLDQCVATNLVKCMTDSMPEEIKVTSGRFMDGAADICKRHLEQEVSTFDCRLIISLSERVSTLLQRYYSPAGKWLKMKECFGTSQELCIAGQPFPWIPVVHIPKAKVRAHYFTEQTKRLIGLSSKVRDILAS